MLLLYDLVESQLDEKVRLEVVNVGDY